MSIERFPSTTGRPRHRDSTINGKSVRAFALDRPFETLIGGHTSPFPRKTVSEMFPKEQAATRGREPAVAPDSSSRNGLVDHQVPEFSRLKVPVWKLILDLVVVLISAPFWIPLMLLVMLCVRVGSSGPIFYRQSRVGLGGRRFLIWKFRTMKVAAATRVHKKHLEDLIRQNKRMTKLDALGDPRLVPFGRILRASGLDELPQIFNVLRREMSLVGPRPSLPNEWAVYQPRHRRRVESLPGLTGYWQVNGKNRTTFEEMIAMDLSYVDNISITLDLKIIAMTGRPIIAQLLEWHDQKLGRSPEEQ